MTALEFRSILAVFSLVLIVQVAYNPGSAMASASERMSWTRRLPASQQALLFAFMSAVLLGGLVGLVGMFFLAHWAAILFVAATATMKLERPFPRRTMIERILGFLVLAGEILLVYLVFFGPARTLFV